MEIETGLMGNNNGETWRDPEDVAKGPSLEVVERQVNMRLEKGLKRYEALFDASNAGRRQELDP